MKASRSEALWFSNINTYATGELIMALKAKKVAPAKKAAPKKAPAAKKASAAKPVKKAPASALALHPAIDNGFTKTAKKNFAGGTLQCLCTTDPVVVEIGAQTAHNHACGCTKCWKPKGAMFSVVAVAPSDKVKVRSGAGKLRVVDSSALIQRYACTGCGAHMHGPVAGRPSVQGPVFRTYGTVQGQGLVPARLRSLCLFRYRERHAAIQNGCGAQAVEGARSGAI
jgi:hypothetical protein